MLKLNVRIIDQIMTKYGLINRVRNLSENFVDLEEFKNVETSILKEIKKS